ncbi:hypothetical protein KEM55_005324, partial [Ascosphaera atra]
TSTTHIFNTKIPTEGAPITNQRSSGRCWLFAACNVFRVAIMKTYNIDSFELSQQYLFFWDKLEKANWLLEHAVDTAAEDVNGRLVQALLDAPVGDGGQWDMLANIVEKYGLIPQALYPDSHNAKSSAFMNRLITTKLREDVLVLRKLANSSDPEDKKKIAPTKDAFMKEIHGIMSMCMTPPPSPTETFTWEFYDKDKKFRSVKSTPIEFAQKLSHKEAVEACGGTDVKELFSLVNDPRNEYNRLLTVDRLGNVVGGRPVTYVNVDMPTMKNAAIAMLKAGIPVFFGSDVGKFSDRKAGILDQALYDYTLAFNVELGMSKADRLVTGESAMTHAMVLTAVHLDEQGNPVRWRVQNSWGEDPGNKGWFVATDSWMDQWTYQVVVDPRFVTKEIRDVLKQEPAVLPLWDPMGALA